MIVLVSKALPDHSILHLLQARRAAMMDTVDPAIMHGVVQKLVTGFVCSAQGSGTMRTGLIAVTTLLAISLTSGAALASPGVNLVCHDREFSAKIGFDIDWSSAFMENSFGTFELKAPPGQGGPANTFNFEDDTYRLSGILPEGQITRGDVVVARCWQTADSIRAIALYGKEGPSRWDRYEAAGQGFQTVRAIPSVNGERLVSLNAVAPVTILENTDQFLDGYFWFKIEYAPGQQGYIWGALLCTDADNAELQATVRRCN